MNAELKVSDIELILTETALIHTGDIVPESAVTAFGATPDRREFKTWAVDFLAKLLRFPEIDYSARETDMRLRVALHFACPEAVDYDSRRPEPRWKLLYNHIRANFSFDSGSAERIARLVAVVLDNWDSRRIRGLEGRRAKLMERQGYRCNCCRLSFVDSSRVLREEQAALADTADPYKPYFDGMSVTGAMEPQVDHITVVSRDGTNRSDNLQVLCALCNQGKGDNGGIRPAKELEQSYLPVREIKRGHRMALLYYRLKMDGFRCTSCGSDRAELTVRPVKTGGLTTLTNLRSVCYQCLDANVSAV